jgi:hypothetical protein
MQMPLPTNVMPSHDESTLTAGEADATAARRVRLALLVICSIALILRLVAIVVLQAWRQPSAMEHEAIARALVAGQGFAFTDWGVTQLSSVQSPPFPLLLAASFKIFGVGAPAAYAALMVLNALLGAASCALTYAVVRALRGTPAAGLVAAALVAVWPTQIYATTFVQAITFITCCTLGVIWLFYRSVDTRRLGPWIAYGLIGCVGALTEPVLLPFMALSGLLILGWPGLPSAIRLRNAAVLFACAVIVLGPWALRNYHVHGAVVPVKSTFWVNVWKGNNPHATGTDRLALTDEQRQALEAGLTEEQLRDPAFDGLRQYDCLTPEQRLRLTGKPEVEREKVFGEFAKTFISENPGRYAQLSALRLWKTVWVEADNPKAHGTKQYLLYWTPRTLLLVLTPLGLIVAWRRGWRMFIPLLVVGSALLTYTLTIAAARFALPYEPWQLALIAALIVAASPKAQPALVGVGGSGTKE